MERNSFGLATMIALLPFADDIFVPGGGIRFFASMANAVPKSLHGFELFRKGHGLNGLGCHGKILKPMAGERKPCS